MKGDPFEILQEVGRNVALEVQIIIIIVLIASLFEISGGGTTDNITMIQPPSYCHRGYDEGDEDSVFGDALQRAMSCIHESVNFTNPDDKYDYNTLKKRILVLSPFFGDSSLGSIESQLTIFLKLLENRAPRLRTTERSKLPDFLISEGYELSEKNVTYWGSIDQYKFGSLLVAILYKYGVTDELLDPIWGIFLCCTGGIPGYGNKRIDMKTKAIREHSIKHDAYGICKIHFGIGPGYAYKTSRGIFGQDHFLSGQLSGVLFEFGKLMPQICKREEFPDDGG